MTALDAAFFDLDGCLVDSRRPISRSLNDALVAVGAPALPEVELYRYIGPPLRESLVELLAVIGLEGSVDAALSAYRQSYSVRSIEETVVVPGVQVALDALYGDMPLAIVTSKPLAFAEPLAEALGLMPYFAFMFGPALSSTRETKGQTLALALKTVLPGGLPARTAMVGDRHHDVDAGRACGTRTIGVTWGIGDRAELRCADRIIDEPRQLISALGQSHGLAP
jgi:phosphoglycolate phosphatase